MALRSLQDTLRDFQSDPVWANHRQFQHLQWAWPEIVGAAVAQHTVPIGIQRQILKVATSTPAWAQNLAFQRHLILTKLNRQLSMSLVDIRFLPGEWHRQGIHPSRPHPERMTLPSSPLSPVNVHSQTPLRKPPQTPQDALNRWRHLVLANQTSMAPCPLCHRPTPPEELDRWFTCGFCHAQGQRNQPVKD